MIKHLFIVILALLCVVHAQPPPPPPNGGAGGGAMPAISVPGQSSSTACTSYTTCGTDGTKNYFSSSMSYNTSTGIFSGSITTNLCPDMKTLATSTPSCVTQTFPAPGYAIANLPKSVPLRGIIAYTARSGVSIYGSFEAGFSLGQACKNSKGSCASGLDLEVCEYKLIKDCGNQYVSYEMLLDECGGHASPYHYHKDLRCNYNRSSIGPHSSLIGFALDGRGIYGLWEQNGQAPTNLDACGGHYGPVPATTINGVTYPAANNVYHYHTQEKAPFTLGCYGPVSNMAACKNLYSTCGTGFESMCTSKGYITYDTDCACFSEPNVSTQRYNDAYQQTSTCSACSNGTCAVPSSSAISAFSSIAVIAIGTMFAVFANMF